MSRSLNRALVLGAPEPAADRILARVFWLPERSDSARRVASVCSLRRSSPLSDP
jgi:hypothetical protein